jgi:hypothetical protein
MADIPDVATVRAWAQVSAQSVTDAQLQQVIDTEVALQAASCRWVDDYPTALAQAILRRSARQVGARMLPLGLVGDSAGETQPVRMPSWDVEIERIEAPYRVIAVA